MATEYPSLSEFYENPERARSGESDYGVHWTAGGQDWPRYRVSYVKNTGEVYAVAQTGVCPVRVLGIVAPDQPPVETGEVTWSLAGRRDHLYYATLDRILDGWADPDVSGFDLAWIEQRLAAHKEA